MKSFNEIIGGTDAQVRETRVRNSVKNVEAASRSAVEQKKQEFRNLIAKMDDLTDLGATNTQDIATHLKKIEPEKFAKDIHELTLRLAIQAQEVKLAVNLHNKLFPEKTVEGLDEDELADIITVDSVIVPEEKKD